MAEPSQPNLPGMPAPDNPLATRAEVRALWRALALAEARIAALEALLPGLKSAEDRIGDHFDRIDQGRSEVK